MEWMTLALKKYAQFDGRSRRKEYWMFVLLNIIVAVLAMIVDMILGINTLVLGVYGPLYTIVALGLLIPSIAVGIRRLHDTDRSGWWMLIGLVPLIGGIVLLVFFVSEGSRGPNRFGEDPKSPGHVDVFA